MKYLSVLVSMSALMTISARADVSDIEGDVLNLVGRPLKNAEVQVRKETAPRSDFTFKSDKNGRFSAKGLAPGNYTVTVVVEGEPKWMIPHVNATSGKTLHLELRAATDGLDPLVREEFMRIQRPKGGDQ